MQAHITIIWSNFNCCCLPVLAEVRKQLQVILKKERENPTARWQKVTNVPFVFVFLQRKAVASFPFFFSVTVKNSDVSSTHILTAVLFFCTLSTYIFHWHAWWCSILTKKSDKARQKVQHWPLCFHLCTLWESQKQDVANCYTTRQHQAAIYSCLMV